MSGWHACYLEFYQACRFDEQYRFYKGRSEEFGAAYRQTLILTVVLSILTALAAGLASFKLIGPVSLWTILSIMLPLLSTAVSAYAGVYAFDRQAKLYQDAINALTMTKADAPILPGVLATPQDGAAIEQYVMRVEDILQRENNQWGQLISQIKPYEPEQSAKEQPKRSP